MIHRATSLSQVKHCRQCSCKYTVWNVLQQSAGHIPLQDWKQWHCSTYSLFHVCWIIDTLSFKPAIFSIIVKQIICIINAVSAFAKYCTMICLRNLSGSSIISSALVTDISTRTSASGIFGVSTSASETVPASISHLHHH